MKYIDTNQKRKSKFKKWLYRILFMVLILLMLMQLHHYDLAIQELVKLNTEQNGNIHNLQKEINSIELHNYEIKHQLDGLQLKINGHYQDIHNDIPSPNLHNDSKVHVNAFTPASVITTTTVTILTLVKGITSLIPAFN